jgi:hypothetical protein
MKTAQEIIDNSGYPLQIHIKELIASQQHCGWRVVSDEHRWVNAETNAEGYIDLILENHNRDLKLVVECKRITGTWTFLLPTTRANPNRNTKALVYEPQTSKFLWEETQFDPVSLDAKYCVMEVQGKKDDRTLEKIAGELLLSLEYLAIQEAQLIAERYQGLKFPNISMLYLPVIVTTAGLQTAVFDPSDFDLKAGKITGSISPTPVNFIRFRKNLATNINYDRRALHTLQDLNIEYDRTIFVVQVESLLEFLKSIFFY